MFIGIKTTESDPPAALMLRSCHGFQSIPGSLSVAPILSLYLSSSFFMTALTSNFIALSPWTSHVKALSLLHIRPLMSLEIHCLFFWKDPNFLRRNHRVLANGDATAHNVRRFVHIEGVLLKHLPVRTSKTPWRPRRPSSVQTLACL